MTVQLPRIGRRSAARLAAVQALYEIDIVGVAPSLVLKEFRAHRWRESSLLDHGQAECDEIGALPYPEHQFLARIVHGVTDDTDKLDKAISPLLNAPWVIGQLDTLVRAILRAGTYEFVECPEIRARIVISEYVGLAHAFFSDNEPAFINAILDALASHYRYDEFSEQSITPL